MAISGTTNSAGLIQLGGSSGPLGATKKPLGLQITSGGGDKNTIVNNLNTDYIYCESWGGTAAGYTALTAIIYYIDIS